MDALLLGLLAALLWGVHDFTIRILGGRSHALVLLAGVFTAGTLFLAPLALASDWSALRGASLAQALLAGLAYTAAGYGLYRAFTIGPVYLVAPICGAYPMLSVGLEVTRGAAVGWATWAGAATILAGIALVARSAEAHGTPEASGSRRAAIGWAGLAALGFAFTFALSQWATADASPLPVALVTRITATLTAFAALLLIRPPLSETLRSWRLMLLLGALDVAALTIVAASGGLPRAEYASVSASIFGVVTILLAARFLNERLGAVQWLGVALVFSGIVTLGLAGHGTH